MRTPITTRTRELNRLARFGCDITKLRDFNPYHKPPGPGGGQFTSGPGGAASGEGQQSNEPSKDEIDALKRYSNLAYRINHKLRNHIPLTMGEFEILGHIDSLLAKVGPLESPITTFRGMDDAGLARWAEQVGGFKVGTTYREPGFVSTSRSKARALGFTNSSVKSGVLQYDKGAIFEVHYRRGARAADVSRWSKVPAEQEVLGMPGTFRVDELQTIHGHTVPKRVTWLRGSVPHTSDANPAPELMPTEADIETRSRFVIYYGDITF